MFSRFLTLRLLGLWTIAIVFGASTPARADCVSNGDTVTCTGYTTGGYTTSDPGVSLTVVPQAVVQNFSTSAFLGDCNDPSAGLSHPAVTLGQSSAVANQGLIIGTGVCGGGVVVGDDSTVTNGATILTYDNVAYGIATGDRAVIRNTGQLTTDGMSSYGIVTGDDAQITTTLGSAIVTTGGGAIGIAVGANASILNGGQIATSGFASDGINAGGGANITNTGTITVNGQQAVGVHVVGDNALVTNSGTITAVNTVGPSVIQGAGIAVAGANPNILNSGSISASFAGINLAMSGMANVINSGTISAGGEIAYGGSPSPSGGGIVITGTGNVNVTNSGELAGAGGAPALSTTVPITLVNQGGIVGNVQLSAGNDVVILRSFSALNGLLDGGGGTDILELDGQGTLTAAVSRFAELNKIDPGVWTLEARTEATGSTFVVQGTLAVGSAATLVTQNLDVEPLGTLAGSGVVTGSVTNQGLITPGSATTPGTLTIAGGYGQAATGTLQVRLAGTGPSDGLVVGGPVSLAGVLDIDPIGHLRNGEMFQIIAPGSSPISASGTFTQVNAPSSYFVSYDLIAVNGGLAVEVERTPYAAVAVTHTQASVARMLDARTGTDPTLDPLLEAIDQGGPVAARSLFDALAPETVPAVISLALAGTDLVQETTARILETPPDAPVRTWAAYLGRAGAAERGTVAERYGYYLEGAIAGVDAAIDARTRVGFAVAALAGDAAFEDGATARLPLTVVVLTADQAWPQWNAHLHAAVSFGAGGGDTTRIQTLESVSTPLLARGDAHVWSGETIASTAVPLGALTLTPQAGFDYALVHLAAFNEAAPLSLATVPGDTNSLRSDIGVRVSDEQTWLRPFLGLTWSQELLSNRRAVTASLVGVSDSGFTIFGAAPRRAEARLDLGIDATLLPNMIATVRVATAVNDAMAGHRISAGLVWRW